MERRYAEIDAWKATAIVTVVGIHSFRPSFDPSTSDTEVWIGNLMRFGVPAFLMASGFLYAQRSGDLLALTLRRLRRILVPYLLASGITIAAFQLQGVPPNTGSFLSDLLFGAVVGPYYYVFIIVGIVLLTPLIARLPKDAFAAVTVVLVGVQWWVDAAVGIPLTFTWAVRNPLMWWAYFAVGWLLRLHHEAAAAWIAPRRWVLIAVLVALIAGASVASGLLGPLIAVRTAVWVEVYAVCALIFTATAGGERVPPAVRYLSDTSYAIYLIHLLFVRGVGALVPPTVGRMEWLPTLLPWACGLLGSIAVIAALQAALGRHSRTWIGA